MGEKTINLSAPFEMFGKTVSSVTLREPTGADLFDLGEPAQLCKAPDGTFYETEFTSIIKQYAERLITHEARGGIFKLLNLKDARAVKQGILGFFIAAAGGSTDSSSTS